MNKIQNALQELMINNNCSIYDLVYSVDFDMDDYKEYLLAKMRERAEFLFTKVKEEFATQYHFSSSIMQLKVANINDEENGSGMNIVFKLQGKDYILIYNLWDMVNYPKEHSDSITLMSDFNESSKDIDEAVANAVSPYLEIITTDVNTKIAVGDIGIDNSPKVIESIITALEQLYH